MRAATAAVSGCAARATPLGARVRRAAAAAHLPLCRRPARRRFATNRLTTEQSPRPHASHTQEVDSTLQRSVTCSPAAGVAEQLQSLPEAFAWAAQQWGDAPAIEDRHRQPHTKSTFRQLHEQITCFAAGLSAQGVRPGDRVALFSESNGRWVAADQGIQVTGALDCVRGTLSIITEELSYILEASEATALVVQDAATLERLLPHLPSGCDLAVVLWGETPAAAVQTSHPTKLSVLTYDELLAKGRQAVEGGTWQPPELHRDDLASFMFTSGTTGKPKAVATTHANFLAQLEQLVPIFPIERGDLAVSYLPAWHAYGRTLDYFLLFSGVFLYYSTVFGLKTDLAEQQPHVFVSVPLMLDNLHQKAMQAIWKDPNKVQLLDAATQYTKARRVLEGMSLDFAREPPSEKQLKEAEQALALLEPTVREGEPLFSQLRASLGFGRLRWAVSGGGSLAPSIDDFYEAVGVRVVVGYGLTETSPVLTVRNLACNVRGTIGPAVPATEVRIVDPQDHRLELQDGQQGLIMAKGPQVMRGYHNNVKANQKVFPLGQHTGWLDTGDLGWLVPHGVGGSRMGGNVVISGRLGDMIVLTGGENVQPQPLEDLLTTSPHIQFAVILGQAKRSLGALIVPSQDALDAVGGDAQSGELRSTIQAEITRTLAGRPVHERVRAFAVLSEPFSVEGGTLTRTMKPRRAVVFSKYKEAVDEVERQLR